MSILEEKLKECRASQEFVEIYRDRLTHEALLMRVLQHSSHVVIGQRVDDVHGVDGLVALRVSDVTRLKRGGRELAGARTDLPKAEPLDSFALLELTSALTLLQKRYGYASVYTERLDSGVCFIGEHGELDDDFVVLNVYGTFKSLDRYELIIPTPEITRVEAGGQYESELMRRFER